MKKNIIISLLTGFAIASIFCVTFQKKSLEILGGVGINNPQFILASSTAYTVTTSAASRLLATSSQRVAANIDVYGCGTTAGAHGILFLRTGDAAAVANTGMAVFGTTTKAFGSYPEAEPVPTGSVTGITANGTCTVLVTEWRTN